MNPNKLQADHIKQALKARPYLQELIDKLLSLGDAVPVIWHEELCTEETFVSLLFYAGRVSNGKGARLRLMEPNRCHDNAEKLAIKYPHRYQREIGFALTFPNTRADGAVWVPHSWVFDRTNNQIVETTEMRELYFGVTMITSEQEKQEYMRREAWRAAA